MKAYDAYLSEVEAALLPALRSLPGVPERLEEAMAYSLAAGGKRLRPVLLLAACDLLGGDLKEAMPFACALEMIHTYSLIHDDLPAMDDDDLRRGRPSSHRMFGEAMAILAGDGLLSAAMQLMLRAACGMDSLRGTKAAESIARRCGAGGMVGGQVADVTQEGTEVTEDKVRYIHLHKTADLLTAPMEAGFLLAGASGAVLRAGIAYGEHLGLAFQMVDDVLDASGDAALLGKRTGQDARNGKQTWVALRGLEGAKRDAAEQAELACAAIRGTGLDVAFFTDLARRMTERVS